jgi:hypothetical protein
MQPHTRPVMDTRPGTVAARQNVGNDTLWVRLAPNPDYAARDAVTGRSTGVFARHPVAHDVDDTPSRPWLPASWNLIRHYRDTFGRTTGVRYGDRLHGTGIH